MKNPHNLKLKIPTIRDSPSQLYLEPVQITNFKHYEEDDEDDGVSENEKLGTTKNDPELPPLSYLKLFKYSTCIDKIIICISLLCAVGSGLSTPANILIYGTLVGDMVSKATEAAIESGINGTESATMNILDSVETFAILNSLIGVAMLLFSYISIMTLKYTAQKQAYHVRSLYLNSALHQDITWYDSMRSGEVASRLTEDVMKFEEGVGEKLAMFVHNMTAFIACTVLAFFKGWKLALVCIISLPVTSLILTGVSQIVSRLTRKETEVYAQAGNIAEEVISSIRTVVAFGGQQLEVDKYKSNLQSTFRNNIIKSFCNGLGFGLLWFILSRLTRKETEVYAQAGNIAEEVISSIRTVVAFGGQQLEVDRYKSNLQSTFRNNIKKCFFTGLGFGLLWLAIYSNYALSFWYGVTLIIEDMDLPAANTIYKNCNKVGEKGAQLSGGQKQRIAIARALVRKPKILLLDEATSALDTRSEAKVQEALDKASKGRTTIIVAHRLSTIRAADQIIVLSDGKVVEQGTHDQLMMNRSHYHSLVMTQIVNLGDDNSTPTPQIYKNEEVDEDEKEIVILSEDQKEVDASKNQTVSIYDIIRLNSPEWPFITFAFICSIIVGASTPLFAILFGEILGVISLPDTDAIRSETNKYCLYFLFGGIIMGTATFCQVFLFGAASERLILRLRGSLFEAMMKQDIAWFDHPDNGTGALCSKLSTEATAIKGATGQPIGVLMQSVSAIVIVSAISLYYEWRLGLVGMCIMPIIIVATYMQGKIVRQETLNYHTGLEKSTKIAVEAMANIRTVVGLGTEDIFHRNYVSAITPAFVEGKRNTHIRAVIYSFARSMPFFAYAIIMYYGGYLIENEGLEFTNLFKVAQSLITCSAVVASALSHTPNFQKGITTAEKVINLLNRFPSVMDPVDPKDEKWKPDGSVNYKEIKFEYPTRPGIGVYNSLNLEINPGQTVALIGPSGCGKSTLIQLLQRFYDPLSGSVLLDGHDLRELNIAWFRSYVGVVGQEPVLFDTTIAENIRYGNLGATTEEIVTAAKEANAHDFIMKLPFKYETMVGEKGAQLSGGQKQRIAIARALVRKPKILLLDEATSALDTRSEAKVQEALDKASKGRTTIIVAHRLSTIRAADQIIVLSDGKVVEQGTHDQLMMNRSHYHSLVMTQIVNLGDDNSTPTPQIHKNEEVDEDEKEIVILSEDQKEVDASKNQTVSIYDIIRLNSPEWPFIAFACITSIIVGASTPLFAVLFGDILGVLSQTDTDAIRRETNKYCLYFFLGGIIMGTSTFCQVVVKFIPYFCLRGFSGLTV
ncbi:multidrug resistance protein 2 [Cephus cinctus]|uniref:ABC-type xenobiotic transporter n=1 Tax=Cephus cinctus TaxID=211228 RepID=A0AAJ7RHU6_CEPCN|nr:multidrug resistance protein 2 [Cephus cinctus]